MTTDRIRRWCVVIAAMAALALTWCRTVVADDHAAPSVVSFGVGGSHRTGAWTPVTIRLPETGGDNVRLAVEDPDGQFVASPSIAVKRDERTVTTSVRPGRPLTRIRVIPAGQGTAAQSVLIEPPTGQAIASTTPLLLLVGNVPAAGSGARLASGEDVAMHVVRLENPTDAVAHEPRDFDAFDAAIVCGSAITHLPEATLEALDGWVTQGGRLIVSAGATAMTLATNAGPARHWLPGTAPRLVPLRRVGAMEAFARASGLTSRFPAAGLMVPRFEPLAGVVDVFEGASANDLPLVVRRAHGFGTITWIGIDLDEPWCANWNGCDRLIAGLLGGRRDADTATSVASDTARHLPDLAGQLRVALDLFPADEGHQATLPIPFEFIAGIGILYCLTLYPLDWWVVRRSTRPWLSWFTLPLAVTFFSTAAWSLGVGWGRDAPPRARAAGVVDVDAASGLVRGSGWSVVRSPDNAKLSITVTPAPGDVVSGSEVAASWFADRGTGFGGIDSVMAHPSLAASDYAYGSDLGELDGVPIAAASSRLFEVSWTGRMGSAEGRQGAIVEASLTTDARGLLTGRVTSRLPFAIERCWLVHGGWLYDVGRMEPGDTYDTEAGRGPRSLSAALTRRASVRDRDRAERWDAASTDVARILEVAGLHAAAGGTAYTGLMPGRLGRLDLSPLLTADRSLLVGTTAASPYSAWNVAIQASAAGPGDTIPVELAAATIVRIAIPVRITPALRDASP